MYAILAAILIILICILFAPLKVQIGFKGQKPGVRVFLFNLPVYSLKHGDKKKKDVPSSTEEKVEKFKKDSRSLGERIRRFTDAFTTAVRLIRKFVSIEQIALNMTVGTGDAATTAISVGALWAASYGLIGVIGTVAYIDNQNVEILPNYTGTEFSINAECIIKSRIAYIIFIMVTILMKIYSRKGKEE